MNWGRVVYIFFSLMSLTTTAGFLYDTSEITLFIAASINMVSTLLKIGTKNYLSAELFATSLVADLHLIPAFIFIVTSGFSTGVYALAIGGAVANVFSMFLLLNEVSQTRDDY